MIRLRQKTDFVPRGAYYYVREIDSLRRADSATRIVARHCQRQALPGYLGEANLAAAGVWLLTPVGRFWFYRHEVRQVYT